MIFKPSFFREIAEQPSIRPTLEKNAFSDYRLDAEGIIETLYEPLRMMYPDRVRREPIGYDTSGVHDMWLYEFSPRAPRATVYLQSGVHPAEVDSVFALARMMRLLCEGALPALETVRFLVVPVVSVWGARMRAGMSDAEKLGDIPHNVLGIDATCDGLALRLAETRNIFALFERFAEEIDFAFDMRTTVSPLWGDYMTVYPDGLPSGELLLETNAFLRARNIRGRASYVKYEGPSSRFPCEGGIMPSEWYADAITLQFGVPCAALFHSDLIFGDIGSSAAMTRAVEMFVNHVIQGVEFYGTLGEYSRLG